jgi:Fe-S cluster biogenesis protein NfuA/nitrite reductase/ring-hydroxylating ferredoxin subunit
VDDRDVARQIARVDSLLGEIEHDPRATEAVQAVVELYGEALARLVAGVDPVGDDLVSHLLLVHDLHPVDVETRVLRALDEVRPYLGSHGGDVELLAVEDGVARIRLGGSCDGCPSSAVTLKLAVEDAVLKAAPELERVEAEGVAEEPRPTLLQIGSVRRDPGWTAVGALRLADGELRAQVVAGERVVFVRLGETLFAYGARCPGCGGALDEATLSGDVLSCAACRSGYDVRFAGRSLADPHAALEPVPLLVDADGLVRIALAAGAPG